MIKTRTTLRHIHLTEKQPSDIGLNIASILPYAFLRYPHSVYCISCNILNHPHSPDEYRYPSASPALYRRKTGSSIGRLSLFGDMTAARDCPIGSITCHRFQGNDGCGIDSALYLPATDS